MGPLIYKCPDKN